MNIRDLPITESLCMTHEPPKIFGAFDRVRHGDDSLSPVQKQ
jgi:hypothetical protein